QHGEQRGRTPPGFTSGEMDHVTPCSEWAADLARSDTRQGAIVWQRRGRLQPAPRRRAAFVAFTTCAILVHRRWINWTQHLVFRARRAMRGEEFEMILDHSCK